MNPDFSLILTFSVEMRPNNPTFVSRGFEFYDLFLPTADL
jgi:hypothetical protein